MFEANETLEAARERNVRDALAEDIGRGDWTAQLVPTTQRVRARVIVRDAAVLCGRDWFEACVRALDVQARIDWHHAEGAAMAADDAVCHIDSHVRCCRPNALRSISCSCSRPPRR